MALTFPVDPPNDTDYMQVDLRLQNAVAQNQDTFSFETQYHAFSGQKWMIDVQLVDLGPNESEKWKAWLTKLRGRRGTFRLPNPNRTSQQGAVSTNGTVEDALSSNRGAIRTSGWANSTTNLFREGDFFEVNDELKIVVQDITSDSSGEAVLIHEPEFRTAPSQGDTVVTTDPKSLFRLRNETVQWSDNGPSTSISFEAEEVVA